MKTNATRILDSLGISYELREYEVDPDDLTAETVARKIGLPLEQVFKTLAVRGDRGGVYFAVVAGNAEVDGKALARVTGDRRVEMVPLKDVQPLTATFGAALPRSERRKTTRSSSTITSSSSMWFLFPRAPAARKFCLRRRTTFGQLRARWRPSRDRSDPFLSAMRNILDSP